MTELALATFSAFFSAFQNFHINTNKVRLHQGKFLPPPHIGTRTEEIQRGGWDKPIPSTPRSKIHRSFLLWCSPKAVRSPLLQHAKPDLKKHFNSVQAVFVHSHPSCLSTRTMKPLYLFDHTAIMMIDENLITGVIQDLDILNEIKSCPDKSTYICCGCWKVAQSSIGSLFLEWHKCVYVSDLKANSPKKSWKRNNANPDYAFLDIWVLGLLC